ncbi:translation factor guf1-related [Holotrichia oblita]|nr:translation factor guf1-related [Holotrichia oblita]
MKDRLSYIRNFCIVAHIDHGKSTLADRSLEYTGTVAKRDMSAQLLDSMDLERERGITIKLTPTRMFYNYEGQKYTLNLIDTPGHVDFTYEVSRSLARCEGAILIVDASQGVEAQTLANAYLAIDNNLEVIPVINKIDLPAARPDEVRAEIESVIGINAGLAPAISAKEGTNIDQVLEQIITLLPSPKGDETAPLKALIFDCYYDNYKGSICFVRIIDGTVRAGTRIRMMATKREFDVVEVGVFAPKQLATDCLRAGDVGFITASIKAVSEIKVGDTITDARNPAKSALPGYKEVKPVVFSGLFPVDGDRYNDLKDALDKLKLNDASLEFSPETSNALGFGFRVGFLGLLHMEIITERLEREFNLDLITTAPSVSYRVCKNDGNILEISNPCNMPNPVEINYIEEPFVKLSIFTPPEYIGALMELSTNKGRFSLICSISTEINGIQPNRILNLTINLNRVQGSPLMAEIVLLKYDMPLNEIVYDFFDQLKSKSRGYASLDYEMAGYVKSALVKQDILLNGQPCDALSIIVHKDKAYEKGKAIVEKLKDVIPRQMFEVPIQAAIGGKIIARETVKAMRKDVLAKCYGGDITRKRRVFMPEKLKELDSSKIAKKTFQARIKRMMNMHEDYTSLSLYGGSKQRIQKVTEDFLKAGALVDESLKEDESKKLSPYQQISYNAWKQLSGIELTTAKTASGTAEKSL